MLLIGVLCHQLLANHRGDAERSALGQVFSQELVEQPAENVALVLAEQGTRLERLSHLLAEHGEEYALQVLRNLFHLPRIAIAADRRRPGQALALKGSENVHVSAPRG